MKWYYFLYSRGARAQCWLWHGLYAERYMNVFVLRRSCKFRLMYIHTTLHAQFVINHHT